MIGAYSLAGLLFLFTRVFWEYVQANREVWGGALLLYAAYRSVITWKRMQHDKHLASQNKRT